MLPPSLAGASHVRDTDDESRVPTTFVGAPGTARGVTAADGDDGVLVPNKVTAEMRNTYGVPLVRPVTTADVSVDTASLNVVHVAPAFAENSTV
jgi:hypothetical protein